MTRSQYYESMRALALAKRAHYGVETKSLNLRLIANIYKAEGIKIDRWDLRNSRIRAAYFSSVNDCSVMVNKNLPAEPRLFALAHELKHHYLDREKIEKGQIRCGDYNANQVIEIGAEIFAAEFIYPEAEMRALSAQIGINGQTCTPEKIVEFKRACAARVSYKFIVKRFEWFGFCEKDAYKNIGFQKLEEQLFGVPFYRQDWYKRLRARKSAARIAANVRKEPAPKAGS